MNRFAAHSSGFKLARLGFAALLLPALLAGLSGLSSGDQTAQAQTLQSPTVHMAQTAQHPIPTLQPLVAGYAFPERQTLTFTVDWRVFTAGRAVFHLERQGDQLKVTATADTVGAVNLLFPVVDRFQSAMDTGTGRSEGFWKQIQEGRRRVSSDLTSTQRRQTDTGGAKPGQGHAKAADDVDSRMRDGLSFGIFYAASQRLTVGQDFGFPLADAMRTVTVTMKVEAREEIKTPAGTFQTIRVQPTAEEGVVKNRATSGSGTRTTRAIFRCRSGRGCSGGRSPSTCRAWKRSEFFKQMVYVVMNGS